MQSADAAVGDIAYILLHKGTGNQPSMPRLFFLHRNLNLELLNYFSISPLSFPPLRKQYWLSRKHEGPKGREKEGGERKSNRVVAS